MGRSDLNNAFLKFRDQCIWLRSWYNTYIALYDSGDEPKAVMTRSAVAFFRELNSVLIEYILLQVCKLTDEPESNRRVNLTTKYLNNELRTANLMTAEIESFATGLERYRSLIKDPRNRIISHLDKDTILKEMVLGARDKEDVDAFFENLFGYVDAAGTALGEGPLDFRFTNGPGDVLDLLKTLRSGLENEGRDDSEKPKDFLKSVLGGGRSPS